MVESSAGGAASSCSWLSSIISLLFYALRPFYGRPFSDARFGRLFLDILRRAGAPAGEDVAERLSLDQIDLPLLDQLEEGEESDDQLALRARHLEQLAHVDPLALFEHSVN